MDACLTYEFTLQQLQDSLDFAHEKTSTAVKHQKQLTRRNGLIFGLLALAILGFITLFYRNRLKIQRRDFF